MKRVNSRLVVITGGSSGIGKSLANYFLGQGDKVINISNDSGDFVCDVSDSTAVKKVFDAIALQNKEIDILICCAGYGLSGAIELTEDADLDAQMKTNFNGCAYVCKNAIPLMAKKSKIILLSSCAGLFPVPFKAYYSASKSALTSFAMSLRMELKNAQTYVSAICPGDIRTNFSKNKKINVKTNSHYGKSVELSVSVTEKSEKKRMSLEYASKKIIKIIEKDKPKPKYIIGKKYKFFNFVCRFIPYSWQIAWLRKMFYKTEKK